ncbi:VacJ family lipoprotein [Halomonas icarae]|uniref:VacJ family lipoprotein n=1 Tax=Halomonas icarae TaxID=2691040 RepID=A0A7X4VW59_9GAMM|nr:VacJ family lipoprotein [Halomonas icarae]MDR5901160.1 VacJ family lipoprotein [Halomonas icarae]NAW11437.1 VacJ family lipoprotein [Halomonas icarae]
MSNAKGQDKRVWRGVLVLAIAGVLAGCASGGTQQERHPDDPWEGFNRKMFAFNDVLDRYALKPVARAYRFVTPDPVETGVGNVFSNLGEPRTALNSLLQGKPRNASVATARFLINSTVGVGGLWDVASRLEVTGRKEDFGQTLGAWGWEESRYLVLPLFGPSTVRDAGGQPVDIYSYPTTYIEDDGTRLGLTALRLVDTRAGILDQEALIQGDRYSFVRDAWLQQRRFEVSDGELGDDPFASDEFNFDDGDFDDAFAD